MKQAKISNFFTRNPRTESGGGGEGAEVSEGGKRKREDGEKVENACRRARIAQAGGKRGRKAGGGKGKSKATNKENGYRSNVTYFSLPPSSPRKDIIVLSPKKLTENIISQEEGKRSPSPCMKDVNRELKFDLSDAFLDDVIFEIENEDRKGSIAEEEEWLTESELRFDPAMRCEVLKSAMRTQPKCEQAVLLRGEGSEKKGVCRLRDMWTFLSLKAGDTVTVKGALFDGDWVVNAKNGFVVTCPDALISVTSLVRSMFCLRRGVLANYFRGVEMGRKLMMIGRIVHEVFQESVRRKLDSEEEVAAVADGIVKSKANLRDLYLADLKFEEVWLEVASFFPQIVNFVEMYVKGRISPTGNSFNGHIAEVVDIEELVSSAKMGVQGRVDMTVKVEKDGRRKVMPLELKTGRASMSKEHRIQVIVYSILLDEISRGVDSGLLLYLKEGIVEEIRSDSDEIRNLLLLRNEFVRHLVDSGEPSWPDPIRSSTCSKCPFARVCTAFLRHDSMDGLSPNHPIREIEFPDVSPEHVEYFASWTRMTFLEHGARDERDSEDVYLTEDVTRVGEEFKHVFRRGNDRRERAFHPGAIVSIGTASQPLIARGKVTEVSEGFISVHLDKKLSDVTKVYRMESSTHLLGTYLVNLAYFMEEPYRSLRELLAEKKKKKSATEERIKKDLLTEDCLKLLKPLNKEQQRAVLKAVAAEECMLIRGPPGTGKTETIVALVKFLLAQNQTVLITGHTHSSVDNILTRLENVEYLRFGSVEKVDKKVRSRCFAKLVEDCSSLEDMEKLYDCKIAASTCLGLDIDLLAKKKYDVCVIDESSQVTQVEAIRPLLFCRKFVLIGDSRQLPPVVKNPEARELGMSESIFERLEGRASTASLRLQYRMNRVLNDLANALSYNGELECGSARVAEATLDIRNQGAYERTPSWLREILSPELSKSVVFLDTTDYFDGVTKPQRLCNPLEASLVAGIVAKLTEMGVEEEDVGVISPYCGQVELLKSRLTENVDVCTVDQFQGRDKDVILFSCTKHDRTEVMEESRHILADERRLTVAVTRARVKLIVVGDVKTVVRYEPIKKLVSLLTENQIVRLKDGEKDFSWSHFATTND